mmetsp:Transcript_20642/g.45546  ORF Transcript_20642/g.45546 Transcript_20642/m.45546 type:complete len:234 (+) Transcript_20642:1361-2062(+)
MERAAWALASSTKSRPVMAGFLVRRRLHITAAARQASAFSSWPPSARSWHDRLKPLNSGSSPQALATSQRSAASSPSFSSTSRWPSQVTKCRSVILCLHRCPSPSLKPRPRRCSTHSDQPCRAQCCSRGQSLGTWARSRPQRTRPSTPWLSSARARSSPSSARSSEASSASYLSLAASWLCVSTKPCTPPRAYSTARPCPAPFVTTTTPSSSKRQCSGSSCDLDPRATVWRMR